MATSCLGVTLAWDTNTSPDVVAYKLYYGSSSGQYTNFITVTNTTTTIPESNLVTGVTYYFVVTSIFSNGLEDNFSNEVSYSVDITPPTVTITYPPLASILTNADIVVTGTANDNLRLSQVLYQLNDSSYLPATGTTNWSVSLTLVIGQNTISIKSVDAAGNVSSIVTETVIYAIKPSVPSGLKVISLAP